MTNDPAPTTQTTYTIQRHVDVHRNQTVVVTRDGVFLYRRWIGTNDHECEQAVYAMRDLMLKVGGPGTTVTSLPIARPWANDTRTADANAQARATAASLDG